MVWKLHFLDFSVAMKIKKQSLALLPFHCSEQPLDLAIDFSEAQVVLVLHSIIQAAHAVPRLQPSQVPIYPSQASKHEMSQLLGTLQAPGFGSTSRATLFLLLAIRSDEETLCTSR